MAWLFPSFFPVCFIPTPRTNPPFYVDTKLQYLILNIVSLLARSYRRPCLASRPGRPSQLFTVCVLRSRREESKRPMSSVIRKLSLLPNKAGAVKSVCVSLSTLPLEEEQHHTRSHHEKQASTPPQKNIKLEAIKSVGITQLHNHTQDIIARVRQPLFEDDPVDAHGHKRQSIAQIQEASRMESALIDALARYSSRHSTFSVGGQCIDVLGVEVSADLKQARAYWCLPRSLDLHTIPDSKIKQLIIRMQEILDERGGKIQGLVHASLRAYHPPKIIWCAAEHVSKDLRRGVSLDDGKKQWR